MKAPQPSRAGSGTFPAGSVPQEHLGTGVLPLARDGQQGPPGAPPEVLRQVRRLELRALGLLDSLHLSEYRSRFKGRGMEFAEVREYQEGDEVRAIEWNVSARMGRPYVKRYVEERELTAMLAVDVSGSAHFGTTGRFKSELAAELAAVLALCAVRHGVRVGALLFTERVEHVVPPGKGRRHILRIIRDLLMQEPQERGTNIPGALEYLARMLPRRAIIFLLSDFLDQPIERQLKVLARRHDVVAVTIADPSERTLPDIGLARFGDPETGLTVEVDTSDAAVRARYEREVLGEREGRTHLFRRLSIDEIAVSTDESYVRQLLRFFRHRTTRRRR